MVDCAMGYFPSPAVLEYVDVRALSQPSKSTRIRGWQRSAGRYGGCQVGSYEPRQSNDQRSY